MEFNLPGGPPDLKQAIDRLLRQVLSFPWRLWRVATADLPTASTDNEGGIVYDETTSRLAYCDGAAWQGVQPYDSGLAALAAATAYGTGTWTPALKFGGATTGITYGTQQGDYTRIGRAVFCTMEITLTSKGSATGTATITGLPFTSKAAPRANASGVFLNMTNTESVTVQVGAAGTTINLFVTNAGTTAFAADTNFQNTTTLQISFFYFV